MNNKLKIGLLLLVAALITVSGVAALPSYAPGSTNPAHRTAAAPGCAGSCHNMPVFCAQCHLYPYATPNATATPTATATPNATATPTATATPNTTATPTATATPSPTAVTVSVSPQTQDVAPGATFTFTVKIDSRTTDVQFAHVELNYDTTNLTANSVTSGNLLGADALTEPGSGISPGKVKYGLARNSSAAPVNGTFITLQFTANSNA